LPVLFPFPRVFYQMLNVPSGSAQHTQWNKKRNAGTFQRASTDQDGGKGAETGRWGRNFSVSFCRGGRIVTPMMKVVDRHLNAISRVLLLFWRLWGYGANPRHMTPGGSPPSARCRAHHINNSSNSPTRTAARSGQGAPPPAFIATLFHPPELSIQNGGEVGHRCPWRENRILNTKTKAAWQSLTEPAARVYLQDG
jgi:hypothetical protein